MCFALLGFFWMTLNFCFVSVIWVFFFVVEKNKKKKKKERGGGE